MRKTQKQTNLRINCLKTRNKLDIFKNNEEIGKIIVIFLAYS